MKSLPQIILAVSLASLATAQNYTTNVMSLNPLGFWPLSTNASDVSGHGNAGTVNGPVFLGNFAPPIGTGSANFTGGPQVISLSTSGSTTFNFSTAHPFTAMAWIKTVNQVTPVTTIVQKADSASSTGWGLILDNGGFSAPAGSGRLAFGFVAGPGAFITESSISVNDGNWHFVVGTYDGSSTPTGFQLYIDGVVVSTTIIANNLGGASTLNSSPLLIGNSPDGSIGFDGNLAGVAVFGNVLTPPQIAQLVEDGGTAKAILSQFAFGGGWYSAVYFTNTGLGTVSFPVTFTADSGNPLIIPSINSGATTVTLAPGASTIIEGISSGTLQQGYVTASLPILVTGYGLFRQSAPGVPDQEAVVPLSGAGSGNVSLVYDETVGITTAVAIANSSGSPINVTVTVTDTNGNVLGSVALPTIPANSKTEATVNTYVPQITGTRGIVRFSSSTGGLNVIGIRFRGGAFTSIPGLNNRQLGTFIGVQ